MEACTRAWLEQLCQSLPGIHRAVVVLAARDAGDAKPAAAWPGDAPLDGQLVTAAHAALERDQALLDHAPEAASAPDLCRIALPIPGAAGALGAVAIEVEARGAQDASAAADRLRDAASWLPALVRAEAPSARLRWVLHLLGLCLQQERFRPAATAVATSLATQLDCERVSIGFLRGQRMRVEALSHSAHFDERTHLLRELAAAMEEASDQDACLVYPPPRGSVPRVLRAQAQLAQTQGAAQVMSVPLSHAAAAVGALTLEHPAAGFSPEHVQLVEDLGAVLAPALALKRRQETGLAERLRDSLREAIAKLVRPGHPRVKAAAAGAVAALGLLAFAHADYRVKADATLEGRVQRAIVARIDGYIAEAEARAGDVVREGQSLGRLDDRDLRVEASKWQARREQLRVEYFEALAAHDRTQINVVQARIAQAQAEMALLREQLARTQLLAPFDGVVVKGDLSQSLGSPVGKGDVLFEIAPLDGYRVILNIDERDVAEVAPGRRGQLTLSALPRQSLPFTLERVTPVATAEEGQNYFRAEARLDHPPGSLRPGMRGVARIEVEPRRLAWIWTHDLVDWLRLRAWTWWP